jgi:hypothetical protein
VSKMTIIATVAAAFALATPVASASAHQSYFDPCYWLLYKYNYTGNYKWLWKYQQCEYFYSSSYGYPVPFAR